MSTLTCRDVISMSAKRNEVTNSTQLVLHKVISSLLVENLYIFVHTHMHMYICTFVQSTYTSSINICIILKLVSWRMYWLENIIRRGGQDRKKLNSTDLGNIERRLRKPLDNTCTTRGSGFVANQSQTAMKFWATVVRMIDGSDNRGYTILPDWWKASLWVHCTLTLNYCFHYTLQTKEQGF